MRGLVSTDADLPLVKVKSMLIRVSSITFVFIASQANRGIHSSVSNANLQDFHAQGVQV